MQAKSPGKINIFFDGPRQNVLNGSHFLIYPSLARLAYKSDRSSILSGNFVADSFCAVAFLDIDMRFFFC